MLSNDIRNYRAADSLYIAHHGILGMRWGKKNGPPYPLGVGDHSKAEKNAAEKAGVKVGKSSGKGSIDSVEPKKNIIEKAVDAYKDDKKKKQRAENLQKAREAAAKKREEAKKAEEHEAERKKALESGDYNQIQKFANESTTKELTDALTRADTLKRLDKAVIDNTPVEPTVMDKIEQAANTVSRVRDVVDKGTNAWNSFAKIWNTFADEDSILPEIGKNFAEEQEKKRKEKQEKTRKDTVEAIQKRNDPNEILKNKELFTNKEFTDAAARMRNEKQMQDRVKEMEAAKKAEKEGKKNKESSGEKKESKKETKDETKTASSFNFNFNQPFNVNVNMGNFNEYANKASNKEVPEYIEGDFFKDLD